MENENDLADMHLAHFNRVLGRLDLGYLNLTSNQQGWWDNMRLMEVMCGIDPNHLLR